MSEQVTPAPKAYQANVFWDRQDCATLSTQVYLASDADSYIDALHAEAEALREQRDNMAQILRDLVPGCKWRIMRPRIDQALLEVDGGNQ